MEMLTPWSAANEQARSAGATSAAQAGGAPPPAVAGRVAVHGAVRPADVRPGDPISARVRLASGHPRAALDAQVWRVSPLGVELVRPQGLPVAAGDAVDVTLRIGADTVTSSGLAVVSTHLERGRELLAARWADAAEARGDRASPRAGARWRCQPDYLPTGIAPCAVRYQDFVHFRVAEISRTGMRLLTSPRNKFLVPGATLRATCAFPTVGDAELELRVVHARVVQEAGKDVLVVGAAWRADGPASLELIGQYLLQFGPGATPEQLRGEGFRVRSTSRAFDFGFVRNEREYREVLALRRAAYVHAGKVPPGAPLEEMGDAFDARSRIVTARYRGRLVGSTRVVFARTEADRLKHDDYVALPPSLPPRTEIIESSKTCTDPAFRGSDLFYSLLKQMALVTLQSRRRWLLMSCTDALRPLYRKLGCRDLGVTYVHPTMGLRHHVMIGDVPSMVAGGMNPIAWNVAIGPDLWRYAKRCGYLPRSAWLELKVRLVRLFRPLAALALRAQRTGTR